MATILCDCRYVHDKDNCPQCGMYYGFTKSKLHGRFMEFAVAGYATADPATAVARLMPGANLHQAIVSYGALLGWGIGLAFATYHLVRLHQLRGKYLALRAQHAQWVRDFYEILENISPRPTDDDLG